MGVYIPNIEKPKSCWECPLYDSEYPWTCDLFDTYCPLIEIVQCKDCKWWDRDYKTESKGLCERNICGFTEPTDFCSFGERRTETLDERIKRGLEEWKEK